MLVLQTELSHGLQSLSEKAKAGTEFIHRLKGMSEKVHVSCISMVTFSRWYHLSILLEYLNSNLSVWQSCVYMLIHEGTICI